MRIKEKTQGSIKYILILQALLLLYSVSGILSKSAAYQQFMSIKFILYYAGVLVILFVYALIWQMILKKLPLMIAFSNKAVTVIWGIIWGALFFGEALTLGKLIGTVLIVAGIIFLVKNDE